MKERHLVPTVCPYCGCGCGLYVVVEDGIAKNIEYMEEHPVTQGALCPKGNAALEVIYHTERLRYPMKREGSDLVRISWSDAIDLVASKLGQVKQAHGADSLGFLASGKCTNEDNYLFQKLARLTGTNNIDHCARLCHAPSVTALLNAFGGGAMTNPIPDMANSDCIFIIGSNLAEAHPIVARWIWDARERGAKVIVADPRYTPTTWMADVFLQLNPGTDIALINGMLNTIIKEHLYNESFINKRTSGFQQLREVAAEYTPFKAEQITGVPAALIEDAARLYARAKAASIIYCMGITQHTTGDGNVSSCANLALVCGNVGRPGTGVLPLRGQNNVQGACDMGALAVFLPGYIHITNEEGRKRIAQQWGVADLPKQPGLTVVEMMEAARTGRLKALYIMGENPQVSDPSSHEVEEGLHNLEFLVVQEMFLSETAAHAHLILPAAGWAERDGTVTNTERRVQWMHKAVEPPGEARADWKIICDIASKMGFNFCYSSVEEITGEINTVIPAYAGITPERLKREIGGLTWPCPNAEHPGTPILHTDTFRTQDGLGRMSPVEHKPPFETTDVEYPLVLTTGRVVMHYNAGVMTRRSPTLMKRSPELFIEINPMDAARLGVKNEDGVVVITRRGEVGATAAVTGKIKPGVVFMPFHFPGTNILTVPALDPKAKIPEFKVAACRVEKRG